MYKIKFKLKYSWFFWLFFYLFIFFLLWRIGFSYLDPDLGWHLKVGQEIATSHQVPHANLYNYTFSGNWVDHEWLSNVLLAGLYSWLGYPATVAFFAGLIVFVLILLNIYVKRRQSNISDFSLAILQLIGVIAASPHLGVRIQEVGWLFLFLLLLILDWFGRRKKWLILLLLIPLMYLWACLHGSFLIGFFLLVSWLLVKIGERLLKRILPDGPINYSNLISCKKLLIFGLFFLLSLAATFFTPYKLELYSFLGGYSNTIYLSRIQEWLSQFVYPFSYWQLAYLAIITVALVMSIWNAFQFKGKKLDLWNTFLAMLFIALSFKSRRHFPLLFVATLPFAVSFYSDVFRLSKPLKRPAMFSGWSVFIKIYIIACLGVAIAWQAIQIVPIRDPFQAFYLEYPYGAVDFILSRPEYREAKIFNNYGWGGYLIWRLPSKKIFIDGRLPQVEYAGRTFLEEYLDFNKSPEDAAAKLSQYHIDLVLIPSSEPVIIAKKWEQIFFNLPASSLTARNYLREYLMSSPDWTPVYYDRAAIIFQYNND